MNRLGLAVVLLVLLGGCMQTGYRPMTDTDRQTPQPPLSREVLYDLDREFHRDPPTCVVVLPAEGLDNPLAAQQLTQAFARRLAGRVERVITPLARQRLERQRGFDLQNAGDRRRFAIDQRCPFYARATLGHLEDSFMVVWSERQVGLRLELFRASDDRRLWLAAHTARRGDGGLPLSPLSLVASAATAGAFQADAEVMESLIDDALRRMMRTLPDTR
ncbi:hypothetical protein JCM17960_16020 [Magnetospira thiophila]